MTTDPMREAFEKWCKSFGRGHQGTELPYQGLHIRHDGNYNDALIQGYWAAWQACAQTMGEALVREMDELVTPMNMEIERSIMRKAIEITKKHMGGE